MVSAEQNASYETDPGSNTEDQIFLLSAGDVSLYFGSYNDRTCRLEGSDGDSCSWWLRTPGQYPQYAVVVNEHGDVDEAGAEATLRDIAVRPAMWIDLQDG